MPRPKEVQDAIDRIKQDYRYNDGGERTLSPFGDLLKYIERLEKPQAGPLGATAGERCWRLAERLYTRWHSMHAVAGSEGAWALLDDWGKGYWYGVAEYVLDYFVEKEPSHGT